MKRLPENLRRYVKSLGRTAIAMSFGLGDLLAGGVLAANLDVVRSIPWAIAVYPGILSARGAVNGMLVGRLSTGLNLGRVRPSFRNNTEDFWATISAAHALTFVAATSLTLLLGSMISLSGGYDLHQTMADLLIVITATMGGAQLIMTPLSSLASFTFFKLDLDPDYVTYPFTSTLGDFVKSAVYVGVLKIFLTGGLGRIALLTLISVYAILTIALILSQRKTSAFWRILREASIAILLVSLIVTVTGDLLSRVEREAGENKSIYMAYPALLTMVGDFGSVVGSVATTQLALGIVRPGVSIVSDIFPETAGAWTAWFAASQLITTISAASGGGRFIWLATVLGVSGILATLLMMSIALVVAILTFRMGLDPDNFVNPIESSLADAVTTGSLLLALTFLPPA